MEQYKYDVFISYSRKDTTIANEIISEFDRAGITYFIDRQGIGGGMEFPAVLAKAIRESHIFLFLASRNSYESKFTQSEIVYAFNKKQKQDIIPYIIDGSTMPDELEFTFSAINWRRIEDHPISTTLVDDILLKVGKVRKETKETEASNSEILNASRKVSPKWVSWLKGFSFTGKHLAIIVLTATIVFLLLAIFVSKSIVGSHTNAIDNVTILVLLVFFLMAIIGFIRPASIGLPNRKLVAKYYLSAVLGMFITLGIVVSKHPVGDSPTVNTKQQEAPIRTDGQGIDSLQ